MTIREARHRLRYQFYDASAAGFPKPSVPYLPATTWRMLGSGAGRTFDMLGTGQPTRWFRRGRYALHEAFRLCGAAPGDVVLAPALHCRTMLDPAIRLGARVVLYPLTDELVPIVDSIERLLNQHPARAKVLLLTHYFGMPQKVEPLRELCDAHGVALVEDCSHVMFTRRGHRSPGSLGRYATASPYKFLPCDEGGLLLSNASHALVDSRPKSASLRDEARTALHLWQMAREQHRLDAVLPARPPAVEPAIDGNYREDDSDAWSSNYEVTDEGCASSRVATMASKVCNVDLVARTRQDNAARWLNGIADVPACRALFRNWPDTAVPYMIPIVLERPERDFPRLKLAGLPIWRWDEVALSDCANSRKLSRSLLHLPCHQALTARQLDWMIATFRSVLNSA